MPLKICHISDTHGAKFHTKLIIPECDVLIHSGDIGGRTTQVELQEFLEWFKNQPAKLKLFVAGNHDLCLDSRWVNATFDPVNKAIRQQINADSIALIRQYGKDVIYLENSTIVWQGVTFYGSPITPSFHRQNWAFNADRGEEISKYWAKIPSNVNVLITHGPPYGVLDLIPESFKRTPDEDVHRGCEDLRDVTKKRLQSLKLHCFGHIHDGPTGIITQRISNTRHIKYSNGAVLDNDYKQVVFTPEIITL